MVLPEKIANKIRNIHDYTPGVEIILKERGEAPKLPLFRLKHLNQKIWGICKGLTVIGARTSQCKTAFVGQIALDLAEQNKEVLFVSLEQTIPELIERLFCNQMEVDNYVLLKGGFNTNEEIRIKWVTFVKLLEDLPLILTDGIGYTFEELNVMVAMLEPKPQVIIVDYIQNIRRKLNESREMINEYIRYFRELCIKNNIAGILCSQINRQAMEKNSEPTLNTLKETGVLEEASDRVLLLHWDWFYTSKDEKKNNFKIIVAKNRNGKTGEHHLFYYPEYYRFEEGEYYGEETND